MVNENCIVLGCDDPGFLPVLLNRLKGVSGYSFISTSRHYDLINLVKSLKPAIVISCFKNNQVVIKETKHILHELPLPLICLSNKHHDESLKWSRHVIVLTLPLERITQPNYLSLRINSVLLLLKRSRHKGSSKHKESLAHQAMTQSKNLSRYVMELDQKVTTLRNVKSKLQDLCPKVDPQTRSRLFSIVHSINLNVSDKNRWEDFKIYFENTNPNFLKALSTKHPGLTLKDIKYCCYLIMNMSNEDITHILGINQESVRTHKYRLKKKLSLSRQENLRQYLSGLNNDSPSQIA